MNDGFLPSSNSRPRPVFRTLPHRTYRLIYQPILKVPCTLTNLQTLGLLLVKMQIDPPLGRLITSPTRGTPVPICGTPMDIPMDRIQNLQWRPVIEERQLSAKNAARETGLSMPATKTSPRSLRSPLLPPVIRALRVLTINIPQRGGRLILTLRLQSSLPITLRFPYFRAWSLLWTIACCSSVRGGFVLLVSGISTSLRRSSPIRREILPATYLYRHFQFPTFVSACLCLHQKSICTALYRPRLLSAVSCLR